jgi:hypothetical protein
MIWWPNEKIEFEFLLLLLLNILTNNIIHTGLWVISKPRLGNVFYQPEDHTYLYKTVILTVNKSPLCITYFSPGA